MVDTKECAQSTTTQMLQLLHPIKLNKMPAMSHLKKKKIDKRVEFTKIQFDTKNQQENHNVSKVLKVCVEAPVVKHFRREFLCISLFAKLNTIAIVHDR